MTDKTQPSPLSSAAPADQTRAALLRAALLLFGRQGFHATSTREIATAANANIGSIAYHFGGKDALRMAAADHIVSTIQAIAGQALGALDARPDATIDADDASMRLRLALERMVGFIVARPEAGEIVQFILREMAHPSPALDRIYSGVFEPMHKRLCAIWQAATGEPAESETTKLTVFTLVGQVVYFRIGREAVLRRMGWSDYGPEEAEKIANVAKRNLAAMIAAKPA